MAISRKILPVAGASILAALACAAVAWENAPRRQHAPPAELIGQLEENIAAQRRLVMVMQAQVNREAAAGNELLGAKLQLAEAEALLLEVRGDQAGTVASLREVVDFREQMLAALAPPATSTAAEVADASQHLAEARVRLWRAETLTEQD